MNDYYRWFGWRNGIRSLSLRRVDSRNQKKSQAGACKNSSTNLHTMRLIMFAIRSNAYDPFVPASMARQFSSAHLNMYLHHTLLEAYKLTTMRTPVASITQFGQK